MADVNVEGRTRRAQLLRDMQDKYPTYQPPSFGGGQEDTKGPLGFIHNTLAIFGLAPGAGIPFDLLDAGIYGLEALFAKDAESRKGSLIGAGLSGAAAIPFLGWGTRATQAGKALKGASEEVIKLTDEANAILKKATVAEKAGKGYKVLSKYDVEYASTLNQLEKAKRLFAKHLNEVDKAIKGTKGIQETTARAIRGVEDIPKGLPVKEALRLQGEVQKIVKNLKVEVPADIKQFKVLTRGPAIKGVQQATKRADEATEGMEKVKWRVTDHSFLPTDPWTPAHGQAGILVGQGRNVTNPVSISGNVANTLRQKGFTVMDQRARAGLPPESLKLPLHSPRRPDVLRPRVEPPTPPSGGTGGVPPATPIPTPISRPRVSTGSPTSRASRTAPAYVQGRHFPEMGGRPPSSSRFMSPGSVHGRAFSNPWIHGTTAAAIGVGAFGAIDAAREQSEEDQANAAAEQTQQEREDSYRDRPAPKTEAKPKPKPKPEPKAQPETSRDDEESFVDREQFRRRQQEVEAEDDGWINIGEGEGEKTAEEIEWRQRVKNAEKAAIRRREILKARRAKGTGTPRGAGLAYLRDEDEVQNRIEQGQRNLREPSQNPRWRNPTTRDRFHSGQPINTRRMNAALLRRSLQRQ